jgi:hypothetical protein
MLPAGEVGQEKDGGTQADFWIPSVLASASPGPAPLALVKNRNNSGQPFPQVNVISNPLCKGCNIRTIWKD